MKVTHEELIETGIMSFGFLIKRGGSVSTKTFAHMIKTHSSNIKAKIVSNAFMDNAPAYLYRRHDGTIFFDSGRYNLK